MSICNLPPRPIAPGLLAPENFADWMAWAAVVIPLAAFAVSAVIYVVNKWSERRNSEAERVQSLVTIVNNARADQGLAVMLMAISELERHRKYREAIVRAVKALQDHQKINSPGSPLIAAEEQLMARLRDRRWRRWERPLVDLSRLEG